MRIMKPGIGGIACGFGFEVAVAATASPGDMKRMSLLTIPSLFGEPIPVVASQAGPAP